MKLFNNIIEANLTIMEEKLSSVLFYTHRLPISRIRSLHDYYENISYKNIKNLNIEDVQKTMEALSWAINNPYFDFNSILPTPYPNSLLIQWFKVHLEDLRFTLKMYEKGKHTITLGDLPKCC